MKPNGNNIPLPVNLFPPEASKDKENLPPEASNDKENFEENAALSPLTKSTTTTPTSDLGTDKAESPDSLDRREAVKTVVSRPNNGGRPLGCTNKKKLEDSMAKQTGLTTASKRYFAAQEASFAEKSNNYLMVHWLESLLKLKRSFLLILEL